VLILKGDKVVCFDTLLQVLILKALEVYIMSVEICPFYRVARSTRAKRGEPLAPQSVSDAGNKKGGSRAAALHKSCGFTLVKYY
jgi:hypothetical protein